MNEETTQQQSQPDLSALTQQLQQLAAENAQLKAELAKLKPLQGEVETYKSNFTTANTQLEQLKGQLSTIQTEHEDVRKKFVDTSTQLTQAQQELNLLNIVREDPNAHLLLPITNTLARHSDPEQQRAIVKQHSEYLSALAQQAKSATIADMKAGSTPTQTRQAAETEKTLTVADYWKIVNTSKDKAEIQAAFQMATSLTANKQPSTLPH